MTKRQDRDAIYVKRQFDTEIIVLCVRWYVTYRLSYRDLVAMMAERGVTISQTTIMRWVIRYVPEFEKRWNRFARSIGISWDPVHLRTSARKRRIFGRPIDFHATARCQSRTLDRPRAPPSPDHFDAAADIAAPRNRSIIPSGYAASRSTTGENVADL